MISPLCPRSDSFYQEQRSCVADIECSSIALGVIAGTLTGMIVGMMTSAFVTSVGVGAAVGGISSVAIQKMVLLVKYPANRFRNGWVNSEIYKRNNRALLEQITDNRYHWKLCNNGVCHGIAATLFEEVKSNSLIDSKALIETLKISPESVLRKQIDSFVKATECPDPLSGEKCEIIRLEMRTFFHEIFVQFDGIYRFYDSYDGWTGLYEFDSLEELNIRLKKHLSAFSGVIARTTPRSSSLKL
ncbi:MAG: hypothetical protein K1000chlam4_00677 [Chlamydiae bacterium]|nr:hypothetical protein [Chlamydiota bacterium]